MERLVDAVSRYLAWLDGCQGLIVDDDAALRGAIAETLRAALGCQVREAGGGTDALVKIHRQTPDLVILDLLMPGLDSFEVLNRLRLDQSTAHLPVLVVPGKDLTPADKERLRHGMARVLTKEEHSRQGLLVLVKELLEQRQAMRENSTARPNSPGGKARGVME